MATTQEVEQLLKDKAAAVLSGGKQQSPTPTQPPVAPTVAHKTGGKPVPKQAPEPAQKTSEAAKQAMGIGSIPEGIRNNINEIKTDTEKKLAANPLPTEPLAKFTPEHQKSFSTLSALLMVMGAIAGSRTMAPATAAMRNMTGILEGVKQGNAEAYNKSKAEFDSNYKIAMENFSRARDRRIGIMEESKGNLAIEKELSNTWKLEEGIAQGFDKNQILHDKMLMEHLDHLEKSNNDVSRILAAFVQPAIKAEYPKDKSAERTRLNIERDKEIAKNPKRADEINKRFDAQIAALGGGAAPVAEQSSGRKPLPENASAEFRKPGVHTQGNHSVEVFADGTYQEL